MNKNNFLEAVVPLTEAGRLLMVSRFSDASLKETAFPGRIVELFEPATNSSPNPFGRLRALCVRRRISDVDNITWLLGPWSCGPSSSPCPRWRRWWWWWWLLKSEPWLAALVAEKNSCSNWWYPRCVFFEDFFFFFNDFFESLSFESAGSSS